MSGHGASAEPDSHPIRDFVARAFRQPGTYLILGAIVLAVVTVAVGTADLKEGEEPNRLATSFLQAITFVFGIYGSFVLGKDASRAAAQEQVRQHARSAFRRVLTLYGALGRLTDQAAIERTFLDGKKDPASGMVSLDLAQMSLDKLRLMAVEQSATGEDALEDWRDLAPDEVARIEAQASKGARIPLLNETEEIE